LRSRRARRPTPQDLKALNTAIISLTRIENKLARRIISLENEEKKYVELCKEAMKKRDLLGARTYASYIASIRASLKVCKTCAAYALEMKVKLVCYREMITIWQDIGPSLRTLEDVANKVKGFLPWLLEDLREFQDMASSIMDSLNPEEVVRSISVLESSLSSSSKEVFEEIRKATLIEANVDEFLPSPPEQELGEAPKPSHEPPEREPITVSLSYDGAYAMSPEEIDEALLSYIREAGGRINMARCAKELGLSIDDVRKSLNRLAENGRIRIRGL